MPEDDLINIGHQAQRALEATRGVHKAAAKLMGLTEPTLRRHLAILEFPADVLAAYREGRVSRTLMWKLTRRSREEQAALWRRLRATGHLRHKDLSAINRESAALVARLRATARMLREGGMSQERIIELVSDLGS